MKRKKKFMKDGNILFEGLLITGEFIAFYFIVIALIKYLSAKGF